MATQRTNDKGEYLFSRLLPGDYVVRVTAPGADYRPSPAAQADPNTDDNTDSNGLAVANQLYAQSGVVTLEYDKEPLYDGGTENPNANRTVDFGFYIPMSLGDRVWFDRNGDGQQASDDSGLAGAKVELFYGAGNGPVINAEGVAVQPQITGDDGLYRFDKLFPGEYLVTVTPPEQYRTTQGGADVDTDVSNTDSNGLPLVGGVSSSHAVTLVIRDESVADGDNDPNSNLTLDFGFTRGVAIGDFIWNDRNADGEQGKDEPGLANAQVELLSIADLPVTDLDGQPVAPVITDGTGYYLFSKLPEGDYVIRVTPPSGYVMTKSLSIPDSSLDSNCLQSPRGQIQTQAVTLRLDTHSNDTDQSIDCGFFKPLSIGDRIWQDENSNGQQDKDESGITSAVVELQNANDQSPVVNIDGERFSRSLPIPVVCTCLISCFRVNILLK